MSSRRGQLFTSDFAISAFVFVILLNIGVFTYNMAYEQQDRFGPQDRMQQAASQAASLLVRTPGYPDNWTAGDVDIIGLAEPDHVVQDAKVQELQSLSYGELLRGTGTEAFQVHVNITAGSYNETAGNVPVNATDIVTARRSVLVNATNVFQRGTLTVTVWR